MKTIWKYELEEDSNPIVIRTPRNSIPLCIQMQDNKPHIWFLVNTNEAGENLKFYVYETGENIEEDNIKYVGTFQTIGGLVYHLFEEINK